MGKSTVRQIDAQWLMIVPMNGLIVSDQPPINGEWKVDRVIFRSAENLSALIHSSTTASKPNQTHLDNFIGEHGGFATLQMGGTIDGAERQAFRTVKEASDVLASTLPFSAKRGGNIGFAPKGYPLYAVQEALWVGLDTRNSTRANRLLGSRIDLSIDQNWLNTLQYTGYGNLFEALVNTSLGLDWRRQIRRAASMLGRSFLTLEADDALLLNVIGLETLLTRRGERNGDKLCQRIEGLLGPHLATKSPDVANHIADIHKVRCEIVHDSDDRNLTNDLILCSDLYLRHCLLNIGLNPTLFTSKAQLIKLVDSWHAANSWPRDGTLDLRWSTLGPVSPKDSEFVTW